MSRPSDDVLLAPAQVQELCGQVSRCTIHRWAKDRGFPAGTKIGCQRYRWRSEVIAWIEAQSEETA